MAVPIPTTYTGIGGEEWMLIGWLEGTIRARGRVTVEDWNQAVVAAERAKVERQKLEK